MGGAALAGQSGIDHRGECRGEDLGFVGGALPMDLDRATEGVDTVVWREAGGAEEDSPLG